MENRSWSRLILSLRFISMWSLLLLRGVKSFSLSKPLLRSSSVVPLSRTSSSSSSLSLSSLLSSSSLRTTKLYLSTTGLQKKSSRRGGGSRQKKKRNDSSNLLPQQQQQQQQQQPRDKLLFPRIILKRNRQSKLFWEGSQLVFSGSIETTVDGCESILEMASFVRVEVPSSTDSSNQQTQVVGWGVWNPTSMYRVRILCHARPKTSLSQKLLKLSSSSSSSSSTSEEHNALSLVLVAKLQKALQTRYAMGFSPTSSSSSQSDNSYTDTFRLVNGEGDGLSGLAVDVIGDKVAVIMSSAAWCEIHQSVIIESLKEVLPEHYDIVWKTTPSRLKQDGYATTEDDDDYDDDDDDYQRTMVVATENGVKYQTFPYSQSAQKTSVYCDQRENRWNLAQLCKGKHVLDLCCYHGGFALNAMLQDAASVIGVDSSQDAIDTCISNAKLNGLLSDHEGEDDDDDGEEGKKKINFTRSDISEYMQNYHHQEKNDFFDVVVLDPPKLAPSISSLSKASRKYHSLNRDAIKLINEQDGGLLLTCTCSAAMTQKEGGTYFLQIVQQASLAAGREVTLLRVSGAASCHTQSPASSPAGNYLTAALFYVHPKTEL